MELGRKAAEHLLETDPSVDSSAYVLYSNVCATSGRWEDVHNVRGEMELKNVKKPACSWVKLRNKVSSFAIGDRSHPQTEQIYAKLGELEKKIKEAGYIADTRFALHDTDEEQKEHSLLNHSERLAHMRNIKLPLLRNRSVHSAGFDVVCSWNFATSAP